MDLRNNKLMMALFAVIALNFVLVIGYTVMVKQVTRSVIHELKKDYAPGGQSYGGQLDPDKIKNQRGYEDIKEGQRVVDPQPVDIPRPEITMRSAWRDKWEKERGFSEY